MRLLDGLAGSMRPRDGTQGGTQGPQATPRLKGERRLIGKRARFHPIRVRPKVTQLPPSSDYHKPRTYRLELVPSPNAPPGTPQPANKACSDPETRAGQRPRVTYDHPRSPEEKTPPLTAASLRPVKNSGW